MRITLTRWPHDLERAMLELLDALDGPGGGPGGWSATDHAAGISYPEPGSPVRVHSHAWTLRRGGAPAGRLRIEQEEGNLHFAWSSFKVLEVDARLDDGRRIQAKGRQVMYLTGEGVEPEALLAAALSAGIPARRRG